MTMPYYASALTGHQYYGNRDPGCRFACPGLCAHWAFSPCIIGGTSAIQANLIAFGLHDNSARPLSAAPQMENSIKIVLKIY